MNRGQEAREIILETLVAALRERDAAAVRGCIHLLKEHGLEVDPVVAEATRLVNEGARKSP